MFSFNIIRIKRSKIQPAQISIRNYIKIIS